MFRKLNNQNQAREFIILVTISIFSLIIIFFNESNFIKNINESKYRNSYEEEMRLYKTITKQELIILDATNDLFSILRHHSDYGENSNMLHLKIINSNASKHHLITRLYNDKNALKNSYLSFREDGYGDSIDDFKVLLGIENSKKFTRTITLLDYDEKLDLYFPSQKGIDDNGRLVINFDDWYNLNVRRYYVEIYYILLAVWIIVFPIRFVFYLLKPRIKILKDA
jgi:hypothetical protein